MTKRIKFSITSVVFLIIQSLIINHSIAQWSPIEWQKSLGGSNDEYYPSSITQTADSGYIVAGFSDSNDGDVSGNHGYSDYWVVKLGSFGNIQWQKSLGGSKAESARSIIQTIEGGYIVAGTSFSNDGDVSVNHGGQDFWVVKLDSSGNIQWQNSLGGSNNDYANSITQTIDSGYIVAGISDSNDGDVSGNHGGDDYWVVKLDNSGNIQWQKTLGGSDTDLGSSILQTTDGGYIVAGTSNSNDGDVSGNHGGNDYWVVKLDNSGNIQWQNSLGGSDTEFGRCIAKTADSGYILTGSSASNDGDVSGNHGGDDYWVVKLDSSGNIQWQNSLGGSSSEYGKSITQTTDGGYIVSGSSYSNDGDVNGNRGSQDYWLVKLYNSGNIHWQQCLGGGQNEHAPFITPLADGGYIVAGSSRSNDGDVSGNHGRRDFWVVKLNYTVGVIKKQKPNENIKIYPNPSQGEVIIELDNPNNSEYKMILTDITGKVVLEIGNIKGNKIEIDKNSLSSGLYAVKLIGDKTFSGRLIIK